VWQGNPGHAWDRWRSLPLTAFAPLASVPGVRLVAVQHGSALAQVRSLKTCFPVEELGDDPGGAGRSFADTAAVLRNLDLLVSVDSSPAHLAGALGVPAWVLVAAVADWRWLCSREDTPWYPTLRLFRQERLGQWPEVIGRMAKELRQLVAAPRPGGDRLTA
jgi:hypothetical protein